MRTIVEGPDRPAESSFTEKKSEFIAQACHIEGADQAAAFVEGVRLTHPKARHVCHCAVWGLPGRLNERMADDGEPSGTAGKPILEVLRRRGLTDCVVTVTRYFGGILLGSGGLIRAYSTAASQALDRAHTADLVDCRRFRIELPYADHQPFRRLLASCQGRLTDETFTDHVTLIYDLPLRNLDAFESRLSDLVQGRAAKTDMGPSSILSA